MTPVTTDPITLEVIRNRLNVIADEMEMTLLKSSFSPVIKEALDASAALFDRDGRTLAQAAALPAQLGMIITAVNRIVEVFPSDTLSPGDVLILNDPYDGGTHLPDITIVEPVFFEGQAVALSASLAHHQDVGGKTPGSTPPDATEIFAEGLIIPPLKLFDAGRPNETLFEIMRRNSRTPDALMGDIDAQIACNRVGARGLLRLCEEYGVSRFQQITGELLDYAERLTRRAIEKIPDGTYRFEDYVDYDGIEQGKPVRIAATVTVDGSNIIVDFTGSSPQARGAINSVPSSTRAAVYYVVRAITDPDIPNNDGCFRPVSIVFPEHSVVNPSRPAAVSVRTITIKRIVDVLLGCFAQAIPQRIHAASCGQLALMVLGGIDPRNGRTYVTWQGLPTAGGMGARPTKDGIDVIDTDVTNLMNEPVEATEMDFPVRVHEIRLWTDSGGVGQFRGGLGFQARTELLRGDATLVVRRDRHDFAPWGLFGGCPAPVSRAILADASGATTSLPSKIVVPLNEGATLDIFTSGGAGYGDPFERLPEAVLSDVLDGRVSREAAERNYGVIFIERDANLAVDLDATRQRRAAMRAERGPIDWTFDRGDEYEHAIGLPARQ
jgi:N-methylhydantoinase B